MNEVFGADASANAIQSNAPPRPLVSVTVTAVPPTTVVAFTVRLGAGFAIANGKFPDVPPPGPGVNTDTCATPAATTSDAGINACSCVPLTNVVVRGAPFQRTTEVLTNPLPFTVTVN